VTTCLEKAYNKQILGNFPSQDIFPDNSLTFSKIPDISLTAVREMSGILLKVRELSGKISCDGKLPKICLL